MASEHTLRWMAEPDGIRFRFAAGGRPVGLEEAARSDRVVSDGGQSCSVAALLRLVEDERVAESDDSTLFVPHAEIAKLAQTELAGLDLPPAYPFTVEVSGSGLIADPGFKLRYRLWNREGRPILADTRRIGCVLDLGPNRYTLREPLYSLIAGIDAFGADPPKTAVERIQRWAELSGLAPADAQVDRQLRDLRFVLATRFTLQPFVNERGEPDFDPILGIDGPRRADDPVEAETPFHEALPQAYQREFQKRFRAFRQVKKQHALGGDCYALLTEPLERVLAAVKERQFRPPAERAAFLRAPHQLLREALGEDADEALLDEIFSDAHLSERVAAIGVWKPKVLPWFKAASEPWLPPEPMGVRVGDQIFQVPADDRAELRREVERAIAEGAPSVSYAGHVLPATAETLDALKTLQEGIQPEKAPSPAEPPAETPASEGPLVLLVRGNLEDREYECRRQGRRRWIEAVRPTPLFTNLHPHQEEAYRWLLSSWNAGVPGVLLADDMGLGKTLEALAFLARVKDLMLDGDLPHRPFLVVAPTGLLRNWMDEHDRHLKRPGLGRVVRAFGSELRKLRSQPGRKVSELDHGLPFLDLRTLEEADWVVASYETVRDYQHSFGRVHWSVLVFDEAQKIKNPAAAMTDAAKALKADFVIAATGTPVENRLADLWCIVDTVRPLELGSLKEFRDQYEDPAALEDGRREALRRRLIEPSGRDGGARPPLLLRRLKADHVSGLRRRHEKRHEVPMPAVQAQAYAEAVARARGRKSEPGAMLEAIQALRAVSLHPYQRGHEDRDDAAYIAASARLRALFEILDEVRARREKALVFVEYREMQGVLSQILLRRYAMTHPPLIINGAVSGPKRVGRVDEFQERPGFDVMLLSPRAGGVGLTLTAANHVIHLTRWWNPAVEDQCSDRVYRIGQTKDVFVHYPVAIHPEFGDASFDLRLHALLEQKRALSKSLLAPAAATEEDVAFLFDETVREGQTEGSARSRHTTPEAIDLMEPLAFEDWVIDELRSAGWDPRKTPRSWDGGADVVATRWDGARRVTAIVQCKHTQGELPCDAAAIEEVLAAKGRYPAEGDVVPVVVTNAPSFAPSAVRRAEATGVVLIARDRLREVRNWVK